MTDIDMNAPLPAFTPDPDELGEYSEAQPALVFDPKHGGYDDEWSRMTLAHLVAVLKAISPEQRHVVIGEALGARRAHEGVRAGMTTFDEARSACGEVSHDEAERIAQAFIDHFFRNDKREDFKGAKVLVSIPASYRTDFDLRLGEYIEQQRVKSQRLAELVAILGDDPVGRAKALVEKEERSERERDELKAKLERALAEGESAGLSRAAGRVAELALVEFTCRDQFARGLDRYYFHESAGEALSAASEKLKAAANAIAEALKT